MQWETGKYSEMVIWDPVGMDNFILSLLFVHWLVFVFVFYFGQNPILFLCSGSSRFEFDAFTNWFYTCLYQMAFIICLKIVYYKPHNHIGVHIHVCSQLRFVSFHETLRSGYLCSCWIECKPGSHIAIILDTLFTLSLQHRPRDGQASV